MEKERDEAKQKAKRLEVELTSLLLELKATKDEVSSLHYQEGMNKDAMEEEYQKTLEVIFAYGNGCCVFKDNIYGDHPEVLEGMPDSSDLLPPEFYVLSLTQPLGGFFHPTKIRFCLPRLPSISISFEKAFRISWDFRFTQADFLPLLSPYVKISPHFATSKSTTSGARTFPSKVPYPVEILLLNSRQSSLKME